MIMVAGPSPSVFSSWPEYLPTNVRFFKSNS